MSLTKTRLHLLQNFVRFYWNANTVQGIHSPFVYELTQAVLQDNRTFYAFPIIESLRGKLLKNKNLLEIKDFGAGSKVFSSNSRSIAKIAQYGAISPYVGRLLFRLVNHFKPLIIVELGTSLGISTLYQASASLNAKVITLEGCPQTVEVARQNFNRTGMNWINSINGQFDDVLPDLLPQLTKVDYAFIDGDHRASATQHYFELLLPYLHNDSFIVIADLYWSSEMSAAWKLLQEHPSVTLSVDFYYFGILFIRKEQTQKVHYRVVPQWWKLWSVFTKT